MVPTAQTVGLLLIGVGAVLCIIKVFCSEAHATDVPQKIIVQDVDVESNSGGNNEEADVATPLAKISEFTELPQPTRLTMLQRLPIKMARKAIAIRIASRQRVRQIAYPRRKF
ncbi:uncharacterized protein CEXT_62351 [Caerostris extrusa]|uniref:Secreted protein n=1 Tax=Caerostris extrusa TaxID=172846 RepID=A0AAV4XVI1_CAEEX|nr:uncharacterized protein CEXT_62351 [Caerostris extrusa]